MVHNKIKFKYDIATKQGSLQIGKKVFPIDLTETEKLPEKPKTEPKKVVLGKTTPKKSFTSGAVSSNFGSGSGSGSGALGYGLQLI